MRYDEWDPVYQEIIDDMGYDRTADMMSARLLANIMMNSDLIDDDELGDIVGKTVVVTGGAFVPSGLPDRDTLIATGASIPVLLSMGIVPDIIVTDLDGDVRAQKDASARGAVTLMHAHGDNADAIMEHAKGFKGKVLLTTQSEPVGVVCNFGGFTDGDRAVCTARHFGAEKIFLMGFDPERPSEKDGTDIATRSKKLKWAERIISMLGGDIVRL